MKPTNYDIHHYVIFSIILKFLPLRSKYSPYLSGLKHLQSSVPLLQWH